ncbi:peptide deformylase [Acetobacter lambici]|uniref:Peptide deformylase-like n=1 Tax=Acetobacter lambici TaxID=1332824 RepID=A0ABT1F1G1_9PROT|nr:peptide deformylase [Acetobacter lambici]MCP1242870.1 peptide deformylase [Acetobacter lambici]MCP1259041.1 peptide deformylase [Acetobacter lambici]NHO57235.1 peptide deformylase [Acetobacter lambici]
MTVQPIVFFPDQRLRQVAAPVVLFDHALRTLTADLLDTLRAAPGIGITGPHIGVDLRVIVLDLPDADEPEIYINPEIIWLSDNMVHNEEGSISMPGVSAGVTRPASLKIRYAELNGDLREKQADSLRSICLQHEIDQLDGVFWLQRLSSLRRNRLMAQYKKLVRP